MVRASKTNKAKVWFGRIGKGIKIGWHKAVRFLRGANEKYEQAKKFVDDHKDQINKAKQIAREHGGKFGGKAADFADKAEGAYKKGTAFIDKHRDNAQAIASKLKS